MTPARSRRGRPPKYGRPAQLVTLTLPNDVLTWLKTLHPDPAWAIVRLHEQANRRRRPIELAELVRLPEGRALILVNAELAVIDRLEAPRLNSPERHALVALRDKLREWRQQGVGFESRAIIVATRGPLQQVRRHPGLRSARTAGSRDVA
jgi:hypothetical protein